MFVDLLCLNPLRSEVVESRAVGEAKLREAFRQNWRFSMLIWKYLGTSICDVHCVFVSLSQSRCVKNTHNIYQLLQ